MTTELKTSKSDLLAMKNGTYDGDGIDCNHAFDDALLAHEYKHSLTKANNRIVKLSDGFEARTKEYRQAIAQINEANKRIAELEEALKLARGWLTMPEATWPKTDKDRIEVALKVINKALKQTPKKEEK